MYSSILIAAFSYRFTTVMTVMTAHINIYSDVGFHNCTGFLKQRLTCKTICRHEQAKAMKLT